MTAYCSGCFSEGPWPSEFEGLCDRCFSTEDADALVSHLSASPTDFPRMEGGRLVWACCVSAIGPDCFHKLSA